MFLKRTLPDVPDYTGKIVAAITIRAMSAIVCLEFFVFLLNVAGSISNPDTLHILFIFAGMLWVFVFIFLLTWALLYAHRA